MENNRQADLEAWVNDQLAGLDPDEEWRPNITRGLVRFREQSAKRRMGARWLVWAAGAAAAVCIGIVLLPGTQILPAWLRAGSPGRIVNIGQVWAASSTLRPGKLAPDFSLRDADGKEIHLAAYKGKVVLLNFWATWCGGCKVEIPYLIEFDRKYRSKGLVVIGVSTDDDGWAAVKPFLAQEGIHYSVVLGSHALEKAYGLSAMPMTFLIDREGRIDAMSIGVINKSSSEAEILRLLRK